MRRAIKEHHKRHQELADYEKEMLLAPPVAEEQTRQESLHKNHNDELTSLHPPTGQNVQRNVHKLLNKTLHKESSETLNDSLHENLQESLQKHNRRIAAH